MAILIKQNGTKEDFTYSGLESLQKAVGGYIEIIYLGGDDVLVIDEEGKIKNKDYNRLATDLTRGVLADWDLVVGDAILTTKTELNEEQEVDQYQEQADYEEEEFYKNEALQQELDLEASEPKKVWTREEIEEKIMTDDKWLVRGIQAIYKLQTAEEKNAGGTIVNNGIGFNGADGHLLSYIARWVNAGKPLSGRFLESARGKMKKYSKQLCKIANKEL